MRKTAEVIVLPNHKKRESTVVRLRPLETPPVSRLVLPPPEYMWNNWLLTRSEAEFAAFVWRCGFPVKVSFAQYPPGAQREVKIVCDEKSFCEARKFYFNSQLREVSITPLKIDAPRKQFPFYFLARNEKKNKTETVLPGIKQESFFDLFTSYTSSGFKMYIALGTLEYTKAIIVIRNFSSIRWFWS